MRKILTLLAGSAVLVLAQPAAAQDLGWTRPDPVSINIPNVVQENDYWCWAALINQLINWRGLGQAPSQCEIVNIANTYKGWQSINCCEDSARPECSRFGDENELKNIVSLYGGTVRDVASPQTPEEIYGYLTNRQVLLMLVEYEVAAGPEGAAGADGAEGAAGTEGAESAEGNKHLYMVRGLDWEGEEAMLLVNDPAVAESQRFKFSEAKETWIRVFLAE